MSDDAERHVFLVWDNDREEHGENPTLLYACATYALAEVWAARSSSMEYIIEAWPVQETI